MFTVRVHVALSMFPTCYSMLLPRSVDAVLAQVPLMPPGSFFDPTALQQWTEKAMNHPGDLM